MTVEIGNKQVGEGQSVYVVGEIGGNHDGNFDQAVQLIHAAADAGADAAKFQYFNPETLYPGRVTPGSIEPGWLEPLQDVCWNAGIEFLCSVFDLWTLDQYLRIDPPAIKIASPEAANYDLLWAVMEADIPAIISTGAMAWQDVDHIGRPVAGCVLLHCVSAYPADPVELNLRCIREMAERYAVPVGFSDHTPHSTLVPSLAVAAGACMIEKHITLDRNGPTADAPFALEPIVFKIMVDDIRHAEVILGDGVKRVRPSEDAFDRR